MKMSRFIKNKMRKINRNILRMIKKKKSLALLLAVVGACSIVMVSFNMRNKTPKLANEPATVVKSINQDNGKERIFLEKVDIMKSGIQDIGKLVFGEEMMSLSETFGISSNNYVEVTGNFRIDYAVEIDNINVIVDKEKEIVTYEINQSDVGVNSVMLESEIQETYQHKSFGTKVVDWLPGLNKDEEIKEKAMNRLLANSKEEAKKFDKAKLQKEAESVILKTVKKLSVSDLEYKVVFVK